MYEIQSYGNDTSNDQWTYYSDGGTITLTSGDQVTLTADLGTPLSPLSTLVFMPINSGVVFDGQGHRIYIDISAFKGCFKLKGGTVRNVGIIAVGGYLNRRSGWIAYRDYEGEADQTTESVYGTVRSCYSNGVIGYDTGNEYECGGIVGSVGSATSGQTLYIQGCTTTGVLETQGSGGIVGEIRGGTVTVEDCFVTGNMESQTWEAGGIVGSEYASSGVTVNITRCYYTGTSGETVSTNAWERSGGMISLDHAVNNTVNITDCYSTGIHLTSTVTSNWTIIRSCASTLYRSGTPNVSSTGNSTDLNDISGQLLDGWSSSDWTPVTASYPKLKHFETTSWTGYTSYNSAATLVPGGAPEICFMGETEIRTVVGWKRLDKVCKNDLVISGSKDKLEVRKVKKVIITDYSGTLCCFDGIKGSPYHPFWNANADTRVLMSNIGNTISSIPCRLYNLDLDGEATYYVKGETGCYLVDSISPYHPFYGNMPNLCSVKDVRINGDYEIDLEEHDIRNKPALLKSTHDLIVDQVCL